MLKRYNRLLVFLHVIADTLSGVNAGRKQTYAKIHGTKERHWDVVWRNIREAATAAPTAASMSAIDTRKGFGLAPPSPPASLPVLLGAA